jgi:cytoskeletal protein CcmA (bactofilin family)
MKALFLFATLALFSPLFTTVSFAQEQKRIDLETFNELMIGGDFNVILTNDLEDVLLLTGPREAIEEVTVTLRNQKLRIEKKKSSYWFNVRTSNQRVTVELSSTALKGVYLSGSGNLSGSIKAENQLKLVVSGSGSIESELLYAQTINASVSGSGDLTLSGSCDSLTMQIAGSGNINADQLKAKEVEVKIAGSGNGRIHVSEKLNASIAGSGNLTYSGNPKKVDQSVAGSGRIRSKN